MQANEPPTTPEQREKDFWGHRLASLDECVALYHAEGPLTRRALDLLEPLEGKRVLEFACGQGITSCLLSAPRCRRDRGGHHSGGHRGRKATRGGAEHSGDLPLR